MNYCRSEELKLLRNSLFTAVLSIVLSVNLMAQSNKSSLMQHLQPDSLKLKVQNHYSKKAHRSVFLLPMISWNKYDSFQLGAGFFSHPVIDKKLTFRAFGLWPIATSDINHTGYTSYTFSMNDNFSIQPFFRSHSFSQNFVLGEKLRFSTYRGGVKSVFSKAGSEKKFRLLLEFHHINNELMMWSAVDSTYKKANQKLNIADLQFEGPVLSLSDEDVQIARVELNQSVGKVSISSSHSFQYANPKKSFDFRFFAGGFVYKHLPSQHDYRFRMSGITGRNDYYYNYSYVGRTEAAYSFAGNQFYPGDGNFKTIVPLGQTWDWLVAANFRTDLPGFLPFQLYLDVATYKDAGTLFPGNSKIPWNAGVVVKILKNKAEIYLPLFMSEDIRNIYEVNNVGFLSRISWMVRFDNVNPFKTLKNEQ